MIAAPRLVITPTVLAVLPTDTKVSINCTTSYPSVGTAWLIDGNDEQSAVVIVRSTVNTLEFDVTPDNIDQLDGMVYECVAYDPDALEPVILSTAEVTIRQVSSESLS